MNIACASADVANRIIRVLNEHGILRGVRWEDDSPLDTRIWLIVNTDIDSAVGAAIRRDIASIAGATVQE